MFGPNLNSDKGWKNWRLRLTPSKLDGFELNFPPEGGFVLEDRLHQVAKCEKDKRKIEHLQVNSVGIEVNKEMQDTEFKLKKNTCSKQFNRVECEFDIDESKNLKWIADFKPKVTFSAF